MQALLSLQSKTRLNNGVEMPVLGLGVYMTPPGKSTRNAVKYALDARYRHIDTARIYGNEQDVGDALKESGVSRDEVFVTTKLWNDDHGYDSTIRACHASLDRLKLRYLDLYLIHWPVEGVRNESWRAIERLVKDGKCRAAGVSNYTIRHLTELFEKSKFVPAVNQVEFHPFLYQKELLEFCREKGIQVEAYSPLTRGERLGDPRLLAIAARHKKTPAQVLIRWSLQHGLVAIPKSVRKERIVENSQIFDYTLSREEMNALDVMNENFRTCWDPTGLP